MNCWICDKIETEYFYLPESEDKFEIPTKKNTYEIRIIDDVEFLYYIMCNNCMTSFLDNYPMNSKKFIEREIGIKKRF